jgi:hypothetical protein
MHIPLPRFVFTSKVYLFSIELAAARIRLLSPHKLLARLKHRLDVLTAIPVKTGDYPRTRANKNTGQYEEGSGTGTVA